MAVRKGKNKNTWYVQTSFVNYMGERKRTRNMFYDESGKYVRTKK
ncbi:hypothetical protein [Baileyella intestinalis]|nr:hypothetical protein [Baileyella intestinalis]